MTIIAAVTDGKTVFMAGDSGITTGSLVSIGEPKIWLADELLIGASGTVRACQVVRHKLVIPPLLEDLAAYFATAFWDALAPLIPKDDHLELLIGVRGQIFHIHTGGSVTSDPTVGYAAIGCAKSVALGALYASGCLRMALDAAVLHCVDIRGPFTYLQTGDTGK